MGEIVWALNEKNDSLSDLLAYTRSYTVNIFHKMVFKAVYETPDQVPDHVCQRRVSPKYLSDCQRSIA